jgi:hypothetical protein
VVVEASGTVVVELGDGMAVTENLLESMEGIDLSSIDRRTRRRGGYAEIIIVSGFPNIHLRALIAVQIAAIAHAVPTASILTETTRSCLRS